MDREDLEDPVDLVDLVDLDLEVHPEACHLAKEDPLLATLDIQASAVLLPVIQ